MATLPIAPIKRLAKTNDAKIRVGDESIKLMLTAAENFVKELAKQSEELAKYAGRKTIQPKDVRTAARKLGIVIPE